MTQESIVVVEQYDDIYENESIYLILNNNTIDTTNEHRYSIVVMPRDRVLGKCWASYVVASSNNIAPIVIKYEDIVSMYSR